MKLATGALAGAAKEAPRGRMPAFLFFGADRGQAREGALSIVVAVTGTTDDPFRVAILEASHTKSDPARLQDELNALSFTGGRRVIWLRDAGDSATGDITAALDMLDAQAPESRNLLIVEAGDLEFKSSLRKLFEGHARAAAVACGGDGEADAAALIDMTLARAGLTVTPGARALLTERVAGDRAMARQALEKVILFAGGPPPQPVDEAAVRASVEDPETAGFQEVIDALLEGDRPRLDLTFRRAMDSGVSAVGLLRAAARALQRIDQVVRGAETGSLDSAIGALRPPLPYSARAGFAAQCRSWTPAALEDALTRLISAESQCKTTGLPEEIIAARTLLALAGRRRNAGRPR